MLGISRILIWLPLAAGHTADEVLRDAISLDRQRVIRVENVCRLHIVEISRACVGIGRQSWLRQEGLEDTSRKKSELAYNLDMKRLELMKRRRAALTGLQAADFDEQINALAERLAAYQPKAPTPAETPKGLVQLKKKTAGGQLAPV